MFGVDFILGLPRLTKRLIAVFADVALCLLTVWLAFYLRTGVFHQLHQGVVVAMVASVLLAIPIFVVSGLYRAVFRYENVAASVAILMAMGTYTLIYAVIFTVFGVTKVPRTVGIIQPVLLFAMVALSRGVVRLFLSGEYQLRVRESKLPRVLIYGAGAAGRQLLYALEAGRDMRVAAFLDDDKKLQCGMIGGLSVYSPARMAAVARKFGCKTVLLAIPSASRNRRREIVERIQSLKLTVRTVPSVDEIAGGRIAVSTLREIDITELLGRDPVSPQRDLMEKTIVGKTVLVTGAGGSIGSELCRQILRIGPVSLLLVERSEFMLYQIYHELKAFKEAQSVEIIPLLSDVTDRVRMDEIMHTWQPETVYHAAAYKHVPMVEHNPLEGIRNNVYGTMVSALASRDSGVEDFVLISTDKAVRPTNVMGASKRFAELILQALAAEEGTKTVFTMVRFGNVLGSSGSVVPLFRRQIQNGGPVTLTHPDIVRYFMTIPEAAQLVVQAASLGRGGDVFVLDMGKPVRIAELAKRMIELSGLTVKNDKHPKGDIEIKITGLRPGEKLYEELLIADSPEKTEHPRIFRAQEKMIAPAEMSKLLDELKEAMQQRDRLAILNVMQKAVPEFMPKDGDEDWVSLHQGQEREAA